MSEQGREEALDGAEAPPVGNPKSKGDSKRKVAGAAVAGAAAIGLGVETLRGGEEEASATDSADELDRVVRDPEVSESQQLRGDIAAAPRASTGVAPTAARPFDPIVVATGATAGSSGDTTIINESVTIVAPPGFDNDEPVVPDEQPFVPPEEPPGGGGFQPRFPGDMRDQIRDRIRDGFPADGDGDLPIGPVDPGNPTPVDPGGPPNVNPGDPPSTVDPGHDIDPGPEHGGPSIGVIDPDIGDAAQGVGNAIGDGALGVGNAIGDGTQDIADGPDGPPKGDGVWVGIGAPDQVWTDYQSGPGATGDMRREGSRNNIESRIESGLESVGVPEGATDAAYAGRQGMEELLNAGGAAIDDAGEGLAGVAEAGADGASGTTDAVGAGIEEGANTVREVVDDGVQAAQDAAEDPAGTAENIVSDLNPWD